MKKILFPILALALGALQVSCTKNLDIPQKSVLSTDEYYANATADDAEALMVSIYKMYSSSTASTTTTIPEAAPSQTPPTNTRKPATTMSPRRTSLRKSCTRVYIA